MNGLTLVLLCFCAVMLIWFTKVWREERRAEKARRQMLID